MSAILSECGKYRYRLERSVGMQGPIFAFFGVNPSTADASIDDQTVRKWMGFTKLWGGCGFIVGNVFAFRATNVNHLRYEPDPIGPLNRHHLRRIAEDADILVPCWGTQTKIAAEMRGQFPRTLDLLKSLGKPIRHLGLTACGQPKHPLMLGYDTPLVDLPQPRSSK